MVEIIETHPSLEKFIENEDVGVEIFHPGGLDITKELADLCQIGKCSKVLDVACGTGESSCFINEKFGCDIVGIDNSDLMVERAFNKAKKRKLNIKAFYKSLHGIWYDRG